MSIGVAFVAAAILGIAYDQYLGDVIAGRAPESLWLGVRDTFDAVEQIALFAAVLLIAVTWYGAKRIRSMGSRPSGIGLVLVSAGALLYIVTALWLTSTGAAASFDDLRHRVWLQGLQGLAWPIAILGLGFISYPRLSALIEPPAATDRR